MTSAVSPAARYAPGVITAVVCEALVAPGTHWRATGGSCVAPTCSCTCQARARLSSLLPLEGQQRLSSARWYAWREQLDMSQKQDRNQHAGPGEVGSTQGVQRAVLDTSMCCCGMQTVDTAGEAMAGQSGHLQNPVRCASQNC